MIDGRRLTNTSGTVHNSARSVSWHCADEASERITN